MLNEYVPPCHYNMSVFILFFQVRDGMKILRLEKDESGGGR